MEATTITISDIKLTTKNVGLENLFQQLETSTTAGGEHEQTDQHEPADHPINTDNDSHLINTDNHDSHMEPVMRKSE